MPSAPRPPSKPRLTYFSSRGRAELARLVLAATATDYESRSVGVWHPTDKPAAFLELRASKVLPFDMLPLWEEPDGLVLAQGDAIVRHVARTHGLLGETDGEAARCDQMLEGIRDLRAELGKLQACDPALRGELRASIERATLPRWLGHFDRLLAANGAGDGFVIGKRLTCADLAVWHLLELLADSGLARPVEAFPRLAALGARVGAQPGVAAHVASPSRFPPQPLP